MAKVSLYLLLILTLTSLQCTRYKNSPILKNGDILFRSNHKDGLSQAINEVTQTNTTSNYTHMGICYIIKDSVFVIHASPKNGVIKEVLHDFCYPQGDTSYTTDAYRIRDEINPNITLALENAKKLITQPYDNTYIIENPGYYCSEFIYHIFIQDSIFKLNPMTFIDPSTGNFHAGWIEHYKNLNINIPEGKPGCNPNEMSNTDKIVFIARLE